MSDETTATLELRTCAIGPWPMNAYALVCPETGQSVLVDPGCEPESLAGLLEGTMPVAILLTHTHPDHVSALDAMRDSLSVPVMAGPEPHFGDLDVCADRTLGDGDTVTVGDGAVRVYETPGHTADQLCFAIVGDHRVVVGDTIFAGGPGKTWSAEDFGTTLGTLRDVVLAWPDDTVCYPGHGVSFRLGDRREAIEAFLDRDHGAFYGDATWEMSDTP